MCKDPKFNYHYCWYAPGFKLSNLQKFESLDPALWCANGYAIVHPDARGAFNSEGVMRVWDAAEGEDGCDFVDWVGEQSWCNGKVGTAGNSWLAVAQWFIAAEQPRHLAAIAPLGEPYGHIPGPVRPGRHSRQAVYRHDAGRGPQGPDPCGRRA